MHGIAFLNGLLCNSILQRLSQPYKKATANPLLFVDKRLLSQTRHSVQALLLLTLKEVLVLLTTIPKGILIFFYTQFI